MIDSIKFRIYDLDLHVDLVKYLHRVDMEGQSDFVYH